jgi:hypothetical protein
MIRNAQMAVLTRPRQERFARRLAQSLSETFAERFPSPTGPVVTAFVERAIAVAVQHGLTTEHAVAAFAALRAAYGEDFEWTPVADQALAMLRDPTLPGPIKIAALQDHLRSASGGRRITVVSAEES